MFRIKVISYTVGFPVHLFPEGNHLIIKTGLISTWFYWKVNTISHVHWIWDINYMYTYYILHSTYILSKWNVTTSRASVKLICKLCYLFYKKYSSSVGGWPSKYLDVVEPYEQHLALTVYIFPSTLSWTLKPNSLK